ncbi:MAG: hypothetical protein EA391_12670 [Balneolaceae bacterium]|nr:MAG: hypothetical protein EA391_12670 [Balneolaceae bacterium]
MFITYMKRNQRISTTIEATAVKYTALFLLFFLISTPLFAQAEEDTTRVRQLPEQPQINRYNNFIHTPFQTPLPAGAMERYNFNGVDGSYLFHRRLRTMSAEDFLFLEEDRFDPYGIEWEQGLNENLMNIIYATFLDKNPILDRLSRIVPFLGLGFFEPYMVPIVPRMSDDPITPPEPGSN